MENTSVILGNGFTEVKESELLNTNGGWNTVGALAGVGVVAAGINTYYTGYTTNNSVAQQTGSAMVAAGAMTTYCSVTGWSGGWGW